MIAELPSRAFTIAPLEVAGRYRFGIACGLEANDPVADWYRQGSVSTLCTLLDLAVAVLKPNDRVLDLGAHLGGFALTAAAIGCNVIAVEASPRNAELLRESVAYNRFSKLEIVQACIGDVSGTMEFSCLGPFGHLATPVTGMPSISVPAVRVDDLLAERGWGNVRLIKLDVEGSEVVAVWGMQKLLSRGNAGFAKFLPRALQRFLSRGDAPLVYFESNQHTLAFYGLTDSDLKAEFRRLGFTIYGIRDAGKLVPEKPGDVQTEVVADYLAAKSLPDVLATKVIAAGTKAA